jgi:hypothetical protein
VVTAPVREFFYASMLAALLAGGALTVLDALLRRGRRWGWRLGAGLLGTWPAVSLAVDTAVFYPTGSDPGLVYVSLGSAVPAAAASIALNLLSWKRVANALLGAVQLGLLVTSAALIVLPLTCSPGHKAVFSCAEAPVSAVGAACIAGGLAALAALFATRGVQPAQPIA